MYVSQATVIFPLHTQQTHLSHIENVEFPNTNNN